MNFYFRNNDEIDIKRNNEKDYLKELELNDLHRFCSTAEDNQVCNPLFFVLFMA